MCFVTIPWISDLVDPLTSPPRYLWLDYHHGPSCPFSWFLTIDRTNHQSEEVGRLDCSGEFFGTIIRLTEEAINGIKIFAQFQSTLKDSRRCLPISEIKSVSMPEVGGPVQTVRSFPVGSS